MKHATLSGLAIAATLLATSTASALPVDGSALQLTPQGPQIEPVYYHRHHHHRHYHRRVASAHIGEDATVDYGAEEAALAAIFWPLSGGDCFYGGCGWNDAYDTGCAFYGCGYGWGMGPFAWGLFGLGFYDPLGLYGWGYGDYGYGDFGGGLYGAGLYGAGLGAAAARGHFGDREFGAHRFGAHHFGGHRFGGYRGYRHFVGIHRFGGLHNFGGGFHHFAGFHGGFGGFHGGGFHGGGFHGGGFHGGHR